METQMTIGIIGAIAYGLLALVGGIIGYQKARSQMSLISGAVSGILLILGGILASTGINGGLVLSAIVSAILIGVFVVRLIKTRTFMPAGLMIIAGVAALIAIIVGL
jgi:uncharacterized membrane protein (UPF0136 family)